MNKIPQGYNKSLCAPKVSQEKLFSLYMQILTSTDKDEPPTHPN